MALWFVLKGGSARILLADEGRPVGSGPEMILKPTRCRNRYGQCRPVGPAQPPAHGVVDVAGVAPVHGSGDAAAHGPHEAAGAAVVRAERGHAAGAAAQHTVEDAAAEAVPLHSGPSHATAARRWTFEDTKK